MSFILLFEKRHILGCVMHICIQSINTRATWHPKEKSTEQILSFFLALFGS